MTVDFRRTLPSDADLEQQKKQAKELLRAFRSGDATARSRVRAQLPDKERIVLADAQHVLAREYGFDSWPKLKEHIDAAAAAKASPMEQAHAAFRRGDTEAIRRLLAKHAELRALVNAPIFPFDSTPLNHAAGSGDLALIDVLLEFGADPNRKSGWWAGGFHPLHGATPEAADRLIAAGAEVDACAAAHLDRLDLLERILVADPTRIHERGGDGQTPLHFARSRAAVDLLLAAGADPDARDVDHRATAAEWMLERRRDAGRYDLAAYVVARGAISDIFLATALGDVDRIRSLLDEDPMLLASRTGQGEYGEKPPSSFHIYMWSIGGNLSPLEVAAQFEQPAALEVLRSYASPEQRFLAACARGEAGEATAILRERPALMRTLGPAAQRALPDAGWAGNARAADLMLELGFDPFTPGHDSGTVLHCAAWAGSADTVAAVLRHAPARALVHHRESTHGGTPLDWCYHGSCRTGPGNDHAHVARLLLEAGAIPGQVPDDATPDVVAVIASYRA